MARFTNLTRKQNLLEECIDDTVGQLHPSMQSLDHSVTSGNVRVVFRDIEPFIVNAIREHDSVFGCVAWLTNRNILRALASRQDTSIIVQKEDFLRPDRGGPRGAELRRLYKKLPNDRGNDGTYHFGYNCASGLETEAVRCVGYASNKDRTIPRMHHKFLVLCSQEKEPESGCVQVTPEAVITGSYNMTENATRSLENIVFIKDGAIASAYYDEFVTIYGISESLDWTKPYVDPNYGPENGDAGPRIGT